MGVRLTADGVTGASQGAMSCQQGQKTRSVIERIPYYQVARFAGPNHVIGNTLLLKHAPQCPESAEAIAQIFKDAGYPEGCYENIYATNEQIEWVIADPRVRGVSVTGSERAGAASAAPELPVGPRARHQRRSRLERAERPSPCPRRAAFGANPSHAKDLADNSANLFRTRSARNRARPRNEIRRFRPRIAAGRAIPHRR